MLPAALFSFFSTPIDQRQIPVPIIQPNLFECPPDLDGYGRWETSRPWPAGETKTLASSSIAAVAAQHRASASERLEHVEWLELSAVEAERLTGEARREHDPALRPFLIRNVLPHLLEAYGSTMWIETRGNSLRIRAGLFGCGGFQKSPVVVFLPAPPDRVDINVSAIW